MSREQWPPFVTMEAFPAGLDCNPNEDPGNSPNSFAWNRKPMNNTRATISCNDGVMSLTICFYALTAGQKDMIINLCGLQFGSIMFLTPVYINIACMGLENMRFILFLSWNSQRLSICFDPYACGLICTKHSRSCWNSVWLWSAWSQHTRHAISLIQAEPGPWAHCLLVLMMKSVCGAEKGEGQSHLVCSYSL